MSSVSMCFLILALTSSARCVSSKVDFVEEEETPADPSKENEDVEVKHTIVVSTKLRNNNRGLINGDSGALTYNIGDRNPKKTQRDDSGEVPVVKAYKSADTTQIRTPDTRQKTPVYTNYVPTSRNYRDEVDLYPNPSFNQWKPTPLYRNVNYWNGDKEFIPLNRPDYEIHRRISDDTAREFYCKKCREMNGFRCQQRNSWIVDTTTPKIKIDGKIAKLN